MSLQKRWQDLLSHLREQDRYRSLVLPRGLDFSSNDYLAYGKRRQPIPDNELSHSGRASRLLRGHHEIWEQVEAELARWHHAEATLIANSGYVANEGLLSTLLTPEDFVFSDRLNHASLIDGIRLTKARRVVFRHNDLDHLESCLKQAHLERSASAEMFIVTESLFGMEGDRAPLAELADLSDRYRAHLIVDEAHATGCFGAQGSGRVDEVGLRDRILASIHTGGKALGVFGAYLCGSQLLKDVLVNRSRHVIFTTAMPPVIGLWWLEALRRVRPDEASRSALHRAASLFRADLGKHGIALAGDDYIVPVILGNDHDAMLAANALQQAGFDIRAIRPPTVPENTARLRISIHADHSDETLSQVADLIATIRHEQTRIENSG